MWDMHSGLAGSTIILANQEFMSDFARMIERRLNTQLAELLDLFPVVAILGPRQVGKTASALAFGQNRHSLYLDLESEADRVKLENPVDYFGNDAGELIILDEIHRTPDIFNEMRDVVDARRRAGEGGRAIPCPRVRIAGFVATIRREPCWSHCLS